MKRDRVLANMVIGANGATSLHQDSAQLSPPADRRRFHEIRDLSRALVVGGNTFRREHYANAPIPVYVATRTATPQFSGATFIVAAPEEVVESALDESGGPVLIEGGISFITPLIEKMMIDRFFITRSPISGDGDFFDFDNLNQHYKCDKSLDVDNVTFEEWIPKVARG
ncbi:MAG: dihydrofolate reductase family protein [Actinomycetota bacterium]